MVGSTLHSTFKTDVCQIIGNYWFIYFLFIEGVVYSFNVDVGKPVASKAEELNISIKQFDIIYKLLDDLKVYGCE